MHYSTDRRAKRSSGDAAPLECRGRFVHGLLAASSLIRLYQLTVGAVKPACCRYQPTCSEYTRLAILAHGPLRGMWLGAKRIARCHPWGGFGHDPVPERRRRPASPSEPRAVGDATP